MALRRWLDLGELLFFVATAYAAARAIAAGAALLLDPMLVASPSQPPAARHASSPSPRGGSDDSIILERNLFASEPLAAEQVSARGSPSLSSLRLLGTATSDGKGFAVFEDSSSKRQDVFAVGDRVFDGPRLAVVKPDRAILIQGRRRQSIELGEPKEDNEPAAGKKDVAPAGGIRRTSDDTFVVDRRQVDYSIENLSTVVTQMRAVPYLREGKSIGFRIFNIRPGSIFERMGLKNGDVVQKVNGVALDDPSKALALLEDVQTSDKLKIDFLRANKPHTFTYALQ